MLYRLGVNDLFNTVAGKVVLVTGGSIGIGRYIAGACERTNEQMGWGSRSGRGCHPVTHRTGVRARR